MCQPVMASGLIPSSACIACRSIGKLLYALGHSGTNGVNLVIGIPSPPQKCEAMTVAARAASL